MKGIFGALLVVFVATSAMAQNADTQVIKKFKNCGIEARNQFGAHIEKAAVDEGSGYVGLLTVDEDAGGTKQRYSLVNCETKSITQINAEYKLNAGGAGQKGGTDVAGFVASLRKSGRLSNESTFARMAKARGYTVAVSNLSKLKDTKRSDCACGTFYRDLYYSN